MHSMPRRPHGEGRTRDSQGGVKTEPNPILYWSLGVTHKAELLCKIVQTSSTIRSVHNLCAVLSSPAHIPIPQMRAGIGPAFSIF